MNLRVYVAATFGEYMRARRAMTVLRVAGATVTYDWTANADTYPDDDAPKPHAEAEAQKDLDGVRTADVVLVLTPDDRARGCGMWIEAGAALALRKSLILVGAQRDRSVFCTLACGSYATDEEALEKLTSIARAPHRNLPERM